MITKSTSRAEGGYAMAALLVGMSIMAIAMSVALPVWNTATRREREAELIFRGEQYGRAIALFQRKYAGTFPPNVDVLLNERFLRKKYKDPITGEDFRLIPVGDPALQNAGTQPPGAAQPGAGSSQQQTQSALQQLSEASRRANVTEPQAGGLTRPLGGTVGAGRGQAGGAGAGIVGVSSTSTATSLRLYNGRDKYNEWVFMGTQASARAGAPTGAPTPGVRGGQPPGGRGVPPGINSPPRGLGPAPASPMGLPPAGGRR